MRYKQVHLIYFSPTHTSARVARAVAEGTGIETIVVTDLTYGIPEIKPDPADTLTVLAAPVYGGRVAETAVERLGVLRASGAPVISLVVYGNRDYEDALLELTDLARHAGYTPLAAGAFIGEHSYSRPDTGMPLAQGRPDTADLAAAREFGQACMRKLERIDDNPAFLAPLSVKGNFPYKVKGKATPAAPSTRNEACIRCGNCIGLCPTDAIEMNEQEEIVSDILRCIKCCACVKECPEGARYFDTPYTAMLFQHFKARREPEVFL